MERTNAKFVRHTSCDNCGSSDANAVYDDGTTWCFSCETFGSEDNMEAAQSPIKNVYTSNLSSGQITGIPDRKISADTCKAYNVTTLTNNGTIFKHIYPYYDDSNTQIATKIRTVQNKGFLSEGYMSGAVLFGRNKFSAKG